MSFTGILSAIGWVFVGIGWVAWLLSIIRKDRYLDWVASGCYAVGFWAWFVVAALNGDRLGSTFDALFALWNTYLWWKNRRNRKRGKASLALGAKTRAIVEEMTAKLKPSPIPSPAGA